MPTLKINPIYANPKVKGTPVRILETRTNDEYPQGYFWVEYPDKTTGAVRIPEDYYITEDTPEDELRDEIGTQKAIIDNIYKGMSDELIALSQSDAEQALHDYRLTHTDEETEQYRQDLERQAIYDILHPTSPTELLQEGLGTALSLGIKDIERSAAEKFQNASSIGDYTDAGLEALSPFLFNNAYLGNGLRLLYGGYHLADENGVRKTWNEIKQGNWGNAALSAAGDLLNAGLAAAGGSGTYDMALDTAARLGNTSAKAMRFARALNGDIKATKQLSNQNIFPGLVGWTPRQRIVGYHASNASKLNPDYYFEGWPQVTHNAPHGFYIADGTKPSSGFLSRRPYLYTIETEFSKPQILIGEVGGGGKNAIRNQIERLAQALGADGIIYSDIADNQLQHLTIYKTLHPDVELSITPNKRVTLGLLRGIDGGQVIQISPEELARVFEDLNGYYFLGHGTGRAGVSPDVIFNNGLRIKYGDASNTTVPVSASNLSAWPHLNSEEVIILPGRADMVKYDFPYGRIATDWYSPKVFNWNDNPGFTGKGLNAIENPHASFVFDGNNAVYTKPESILGVYNTRTLTLRLNPNSQYKFLFNESPVAQDAIIYNNKYFGQPSSRTDTPTYLYNPLKTRLNRLQNRDVYPNRILYWQDVLPDQIRNVAKQIQPDLTEDLLDQVVQMLMTNKRGSYLSFGDDLGNTTSGIGIVDVEDAIKYLKESGISNPTKADIETIVGHEAGHGVKVSEEALNAVRDYYAPDEFYTQAGLIFDSFGITDTSNPVRFNQFMDMTNTYLKSGHLDNGISKLRTFMNSLSPVDRLKVMKHINRFSATLPVMLAIRQIYNGKTL